MPRRRGARVITLAVVGASGAVPVPEVNGLTLAAAKAKMLKAGLRVESERANGGSTTRDDDEVVDTDVAPDRQVPKGATITLLTARRPAS